MIYDVFYFNNELDTLELRLNILDKYVDFFVISEATETFSGVPKPLYYLENKLRFKKWEHKIIHHLAVGDTQLLQMALNSPNTGGGEHYWVREFIQKESVRNLIRKFKDYDTVYISDVDEIWNPEMKLDMTRDIVYKPKQLPYLYYLNQRTDEDWLGWTGTTVCKAKIIKKGIINHIRTDDLQEYEVVENGGWHFNSLGGKQEKIDAFKHPVYYDENVWQQREVGMRVDEKDLPTYILDNKEKYTHLWKRN
jgi:beta-1,4-mannosyl-glycoprotein beta-1,4-N-acetylglucosaminyltransferase